ncbi:MAG: DUF4493 domain-containing protein [Bacteroidales bacterium]|nr:DUF4493 domain-containing protein [Bacteroidales bacterium]
MKNNFYLRAALSLCASGILAAACFKSMTPGEETTIRVNIERDVDFPTRTADGIDIDDFILNVTGAEGEEIYSGLFKDSPEIFKVSPGSYTVCAVSKAFSEPEYDSPVFGDTRVVVAGPGDAVSVTLNCDMQNCGMKLEADAGFRMTFPDAVIYMNSSEGCLQYNYEEVRTGYFNPGKITVTMSREGDTETLFTKVLDKRQIMNIGLSAPLGDTDGAAGITIQVDTTKEWLSEEFVYGQGADSPQAAISVHEARELQGATGVWVCGHIAGCATSTSKVEFDGPYTKNTNLVLGERTSTADRDHCMTVELKSGAIRDALNLQDNPGNKGRKVMVKGDIVSSYFGMPGIKNITEYSF